MAWRVGVFVRALQQKGQVTALTLRQHGCHGALAQGQVLGPTFYQQ